jgi:hypothetical protein
LGVVVLSSGIVSGAFAVKQRMHLHATNPFFGSPFFWADTREINS